MRGKSPPTAVEIPCLLDALRLNFSPVVIDDDEMETDRVQKACEVIQPCELWRAFRLGYDVTWHACAHREFALTEVRDSTHGAKVSICREVFHEASVA